jgi:hypothetical protein
MIATHSADLGLGMQGDSASEFRLEGTGSAGDGLGGRPLSLRCGGSGPLQDLDSV